MRGRYSIQLIDAFSLLMHFESICITCDLFPRGEWSVPLKSCLIMKIAAAEYILSTMLLNHMYFISRKCESDPLDITDITEVWNIKVMIIQLPVSHSRRRHNFSSNIHLFRIHSSKVDCLYFKGEGVKLGDLSGAMSSAMSSSTLSGVYGVFCWWRCALVTTENCPLSRFISP